jgi:hypothetical protein
VKHSFPVAMLMVAAAASLGLAQEPAATGGPPAPVASPAPSPSPTPQTPAPTPTGPRGPADPKGLTQLNLFGDSSGQVTSGSAFNPSVSVIPDGVYYNDSPDGGVGEIMEEADGLGAGHAHGVEEGGHSHGGAAERGFSLREAEIAFSGAVDPYFDVWAIFAVGGGEIEVEEGYFQTRRFLPGLQLRAGKFYSGFGYINKQHPHQWDFVDGALPYDLLLGGAINDTGVQLTWLPSLPFYTQLGVEALQGDNEGFAAHLGGEASPFFDEKAGPRLFTGWLKISPDVGYSNALQVGVSYAFSRRHQELVAHEHGHGGEEAHVDEAFQGDGQVLGFDFVWKYDSPRQYGQGDFSLQAEYLRRVNDLSLVGAGAEAAGGETRKATQDGFYAQAVYGFAPRFTLGLRYEGTEAFDASRRFSGNLTFNPTEFSRFRVQYARGDFAVGGAREKYDQVYVQFQMSLGAHGAHRF